MNKIKMQLFGCLCLSRGDAVLDEKNLHSKRLTQLLVYILIHRNAVLSNQKLIEVFLKEKSAKPEGALRNLMYRLRSALQILGEEEYICTLREAYRWNPEIEVEADYENFEKAADHMMAAEKSGNFLKCREWCREVLSLYRGNVTVSAADEVWLISKVTWYRSLYVEAVKKICASYGEEKNWQEIEKVSRNALEVDPYEEDIHYWMIRSLYYQNDIDLALQYYEKAVRLLGNIGVMKPEKLYVLFQEMTSCMNGFTDDIRKLLADIVEPVEADSAFLCDYLIFRQICRVEMRQKDRLGMPLHVLFLTVKRTGGAKRNMTLDQGLAEGMEVLEEILRTMQRIGDAAARYSQTQFAVMLPACSRESCIAVGERIKHLFIRRIGKRHLELQYELAELPGQRRGKADRSEEADV